MGASLGRDTEITVWAVIIYYTTLEIIMTFNTRSFIRNPDWPDFSNIHDPSDEKSYIGTIRRYRSWKEKPRYSVKNNIRYYTGSGWAAQAHVYKAEWCVDGQWHCLWVVNDRCRYDEICFELTDWENGGKTDEYLLESLNGQYTMSNLHGVVHVDSARKALSVAKKAILDALNGVAAA